MTINPTARFQIVPVHTDSFGREVIASNAIAHGPLSVIMERVLDSRTRNDAIELTHKAAKAIGTLESYGQLRQQLQSREDAVAERENVLTATLLQECLAKLDTLGTRLDALEEPEPEEIVFPPGCEREFEELEEPASDADPEDLEEHLPQEASPAGDLHVIAAKRDMKRNGHKMNGDSDGDEGPGVLPRSPVPPVEDPLMGSEPELTLPPDPPEDD